MNKPSELMSAIYALVDANPDIEKVKALTVETLKRRDGNEPYAFSDVFYEYGTKASSSYYRHSCKLCCAFIDSLEDRSSQSAACLAHVKWHNAMESRLRELEKTAHLHQPQTAEAEQAQPEHHPEGNCFARAERSYTSQPHELNVNGPYGKFTRNP